MLLRLIEEGCELDHRCRETPVSAAMTSPAITISTEDGFREILAAFGRHAGRSMPVLDKRGRLSGLLLRKDFLSVFTPDGLP